MVSSATPLILAASSLVRVRLVDMECCAFLRGLVFVRICSLFWLPILSGGCVDCYSNKNACELQVIDKEIQKET